MQREILFRGKTKEGYWVEGYLASPNSINVDVSDPSVGLFLVEEYEVMPETVGQYTGLKDKNGNKIFEGDILDVCNGSINGIEWKDKPYDVKINARGWDICLFCWDKETGESVMDSTHWCLVIGNIHDNPELFK